MQPVSAYFDMWIRQADGDHFYLKPRALTTDLRFTPPTIPSPYPTELLFAPGVLVPVNPPALRGYPLPGDFPNRMWLGPNEVEMEVGEELLSYARQGHLLTEFVGRRKLRHEEVGFY
jgi:hypothetical protein